MNWKALVRRLLTWMLYGVCLSLLPLLFVWYQRVDGGRPHSLYDVLAAGELLIISVVLIGAALGDLLVADRIRPLSIPEIANIFAAVWVMIFASWLYGRVSFGHQETERIVAPDAAVTRSSVDTATTSLITFGMCVVVGVCTIVLTSLETHE